MTEEHSRFTTPEERKNISGINLNQSDVDQFLEMMRKGLLSSASAHDSAVQDNFGLRAEVTVRLSRPVNDGNGGVAEVESFTMEHGEIRASKQYIDPAAAPHHRRKVGGRYVTATCRRVGGPDPQTPQPSAASRPVRL